MSTSLIPLDTLGATIKAHVAKGDASIEKAEQHYKAAGIHLVEAKARIKETPGLTWPAFLNAHCSIRRSRADELIMIADGRTTLTDLRMKKAESVRATRERKSENLPLRSGEPVAAITETVSSGDMYPDDEVARLRAEIETLKKKLAKAEEAAKAASQSASVMEGRAQTIERELEGANLARLYAEQDKDRLAAELEDMREEVERMKEPGGDYESGLRRAEEMLINEYYGVADDWLSYSGIDESHPAYRHRIEAHNAFIAEPVGFADVMLMIQHEAFGRLNDYFSSSCTYNGLHEGRVKEAGWIKHAEGLEERRLAVSG